MQDVHGGSMGARADKGGVSGVRVYVGNAGSQSVETIEQAFPLWVEEWCLVPDTGGAGRFRGGLAARRTYRVEYDKATFTVSAERGRSTPQGQFSGQPGALFQCTVRKPDGTAVEVAAKGGQTVMHRGDHVSIQPACSGGYGDPAQRPRRAVEDDVANGYVSRAEADRHHSLANKPAPDRRDVLAEAAA